MKSLIVDDSCEKNMLKWPTKFKVLIKIPWVCDFLVSDKHTSHQNNQSDDSSSNKEEWQPCFDESHETDISSMNQH